MEWNAYEEAQLLFKIHTSRNLEMQILIQKGKNASYVFCTKHLFAQINVFENASKNMYFKRKGHVNTKISQTFWCRNKKYWIQHIPLYIWPKPKVHNFPQLKSHTKFCMQIKIMDFSVISMFLFFFSKPPQIQIPQTTNFWRCFVIFFLKRQ